MRHMSKWDIVYEHVAITIAHGMIVYFCICLCHARGRWIGVQCQNFSELETRHLHVEIIYVRIAAAAAKHIAKEKQRITLKIVVFICWRKPLP